MKEHEPFRVKTRFQFLDERDRWREEVARTKSKHDVVCDPEEAIICDVCNDLIETDLLWINDYGVYCTKCRKKS